MYEAGHDRNEFVLDTTLSTTVGVGKARVSTVEQACHAFRESGGDDHDGAGAFCTEGGDDGGHGGGRSGDDRQFRRFRQCGDVGITGQPTQLTVSRLNLRSRSVSPGLRPVVSSTVSRTRSAPRS